MNTTQVPEGYEKYPRSHGHGSSNTISITRTGFGLPARFCEAQKLQSYRSVVPHFNAKKNHIALRFTSDKQEPDRYAVTRRRGHGAEISAKSFFGCYGIEVNQCAGHYVPTRHTSADLGVDSSDIWLIIDLTARTVTTPQPIVSPPAETTP